MPLLHFFRSPGPSSKQCLDKISAKIPEVVDVKTEYCFNVELKEGVEGCDFDDDQRTKLVWLFTETFEPEGTSNTTFLSICDDDSAMSAHKTVVEV